MRTTKIIIAALWLFIASSVLAAGYSLGAAAKAAGELMPKDGPKEFTLFNLPEPKAKPEQLLSLFRQAKGGKACLAICAPKLDCVRDLLKSSLKAAKAEKFDGLYLIIVAERIDAAEFDEILKDRGIIAKYGAIK